MYTTFCVYRSEMLFTADACMWYGVNSDVKLTVFGNVFEEILVMLGIKFITILDVLQGFYTSLEI